jgi:hypothetical protein
MSPNPCLYSFYRLGNPMMIWGSWLSGSGCFQFCPCLADGPWGSGGRSTWTVFFACSSCSCSASLSIRFGFEFWLEVVSDGPRVLGGQSACSPRTVHFSGFASSGSVGFNEQSAAQDGRSARACVLCFLVRFLSSLLVLPRVLQGIVPRTRGWSITSLSWRLVCDSINRLCVTGIWLGYRSGSLRRIFTSSYSLPPL